MLADTTDITATYPLSPLQEGMLFHSLYAPRAGLYFVQMRFRLTDLDPAAFRRAWPTVLGRHDILRTAFAYDAADEPMQYVHAAPLLPWEERDWRSLDATRMREEMRAYLDADRARGFTLAEAPLMRCVLMRVGEADYDFVWSYHHLLLDGWSVPLLLGEVRACYEAYLQQSSPQLPPPRQYREYIAWLQSQDEGAAERFWREELRRCTPTLLCEGARGLVHDDAGHGVVHREISEPATSSLQTFARRHGLTLNTLMQGAWALLLSRYSGKATVVFGTTVAGRPAALAGVQSMIGLFVNTLPFRVVVRDEQPLIEWLRGLQRQYARLRRFEYAPLPKIQAWSEVPRGQSLFDTTLTFENYPVPHTKRGGAHTLTVAELSVAERTHYPVSVLVTPAARLQLSIGYERLRVESQLAEQMLDHLLALAQAMASDDHASRTLGEVEVLRPRFASSATGSGRAVSRDERRVDEMVSRWATETPDATAVMHEERRVSYRELEREADQIAAWLYMQGVGPESRVGIALERSPDMVAAILGVWKCGAAFVPVDPANPDARIASMLDDADVAIVLTCERLRPRLPVDAGPTVSLDTERGLVVAAPRPPRLPQAGPANLAYIFYTSGSTGTPKGVMISHAGLSNYVTWSSAAYGADDGVGAPVQSSLAFDLTLTSLLCPLTQGRAVILLAADDPVEDLARSLAGDVELSLIKITPSHLRVLEHHLAVAPHLAPLRTIVIGGEALSGELLDLWRARAPQTRIVNEYGPTETVVGCCIYERLAGDIGPGPVPIGRPIDNTRLLVMDEDLELMPIGRTGELCIGGLGVARGYAKDPARTAEKFVPDPLGVGSRLYRTGDLVRYRSDGDLEFLGRRDSQVKIRGFRVELGEIESVLQQHTAIGAARVLTGIGPGGSGPLVAYVVLRAGSELSTPEMQQWLAERLPEWMVPASFVQIDEFPLTANGKLDVETLRTRQSLTTAREFVPPRTHTETLLATIWQDVLGLDRVGINDNFFQVGGDSLNSLRIAAKAERAGFALTVRDLFAHQTIAQLAAKVAPSSAVEPHPRTVGIPEVPRGAGLGEEDVARLAAAYPNAESIHRLAPVQEGLLFHTLYAPSSAVYVLQYSFSVTGLNRVAFREAWARAVERHEILRTAFPSHGLANPVQIVCRDAAIEWIEDDWRGLDLEAQRQRLAAYRTRDRMRGFDLAQPPLVRLTLLRLGNDEYHCLWTYHHILLDGWSASLLIQEILQSYDALANGRPPALPKPRPYREYLAWLGAQPEAEAATFWTNQLRGVSGPTPCDFAPADVPDASAVTTAGVVAEYGECRRLLSRDVTVRLAAVASGARVTLNTIVQGAWAILLHRYCGEHTVVFGTTVSIRPTDLPNVESMLGMFVNTVPFRVDIPSTRRVVPWLQHLQQLHVDVRHHAHVVLRAIQGWSEIPRGTPLFETVITFENFPRAQRRGSGSLAVDQVNSFGRDHFPCSVTVTPGDRLAVTIRYDHGRFSASGIEHALACFERVLESIAAEPDQCLSEVDVLPSDERRLVAAWNDTAFASLHDRCLHELIEQQVAARPDATAVVFGEQHVSYAQLNRRANQLAYHLRSLGAGPETLVGVSLERSDALVVALLGVMKAGAAYVPLEPHLPDARLGAITTGAGVPLIVTIGDWQSRLETCGATIICLDEDARFIDVAPDDNPVPLAGPDNAIYVLHTSGSTGTPNGVTNIHRGLINRIVWMRDAYGITAADRIAHKTPYGFDVSAWELFLPLITGATMIVVAPDAHRDAAALIRIFLAEQVTTTHFVPPMLAAVLETPGIEALRALRYVFCSGEALGYELQQTFFARSFGELVNFYGPTEASIDVTHWRCQRSSALPFVPIGRPIGNCTAYVVDDQQRPAPVGVAGELCVGGVGVARGYLRRPGQTADRFVPNPHGPAGERLYRTGDIARYRPDGVIEFLGRADTQVKLRGFRIELGEIEAALQASPDVRAGVVALERGDGSTSQLVAYVVAASGRSPDVVEQSLRAHLTQTLPDYMMPAVFAFLDALPLTASGKTDRRQLRRPQRPVDPSLLAAPTNDIEAALVETWQDVLGVARVGLDDNFFDLGGDSILSIQAVSKAWTRGIKLTVRQLFEHPTVRRVAAVAERDDVEDVASELEPDASVPLTPIQRQFFAARREQPDYYNQAVLLEMPPCDLAVVERAIAAIIRRHDALRARFVHGADGWTQQVSASEASLVVGEFDLSRVPESELHREIARSGEQLQASLRLATGPLLRVALMRLGGAETRLACVIHHLAIDAVSWRVLLAELETHFAGHSPARDRLQRNPPSFAHWARALDEYAHGEAIAAEHAYWIQRCRWDVGTVPVDSEAPNVIGAARSISVSLSPSDTERLVRDLPRLYRADVEEMLLTSVAVAFGEVLGFERVRLDVEGHGRENIVAGLDPTLIVGWLTTLFPVVLQVEHGSLAASLARVKEQMRGVPQRGIGYGLLCEMSGRDDVEALRTAPPSGISFNYLGQIAAGEQSAFRLARESLGPTQPPGERRRYEIDIIAKTVHGTLTLEWTYHPSRLSEEVMRRLADRTAASLHALIDCASHDANASFVPSDFPLAKLSASHLAALAAVYPDLEDIYPISPVQQGLIFHSLYSPESGIYVLQLGMRLNGLDLEAFRQAWAIVIDCHDILRTVFVHGATSAPLQVVRRASTVQWHEEDLRGSSDSEQLERIAARRAGDRLRAFDFARGPLMRLSLARLGTDDYDMLWSYHHVILDGWSGTRVMQDVVQCYETLRGGGRPELVKPRRYRDYIEWLAGQRPDAAVTFWRGELAGAAATCLVVPDAHTHGDASQREEWARLTPDVDRALQHVARDCRVTLNTLFQAAWALVVAAMTETDDVVFGTTVSGRPAMLAGVESMLGNFVNTVPLRVTLPADLAVADWLQAIQQRHVRMREYEHTPLNAITAALGRGSTMPLFDTILAFQNFPLPRPAGPASAFDVADIWTFDRNHYPVSLAVLPGESVRLRMACDAARVNPAVSRSALDLAVTACAALARGTAAGRVADLLAVVRRASDAARFERDAALRAINRAGLAGARRKRVAVTS